MQAALEAADAVIVATDWPEFVAYDAEKYAAHVPGGIFVDAMNRFDPAAITKAGMRYIGVGRQG
jgi:UDPglucose 6-dehydrogenase